MKVYHSIEDFPSNIKTIVTIGTFDGVHKGHRILIKRINSIAKKEGLQSVLLTLHPHPRHVLYPDNQELKLINTIEERIDGLTDSGLQNLVIHKFTKEFSRIRSVNFIRDFLVNRLNMQYIVVGFNHHFGQNREGTFHNLVELSVLYDFKIEKVAPQNIEGVTISSTKIRKLIVNGDMQTANLYLGSNFFISGKVIEGNKLGNKIGFPTANISTFSEWKILPKDGVYAVKVLVQGEYYFGMLNIGNRPSISDDTFVVEVHLFDFDAIIYNKEVKVSFYRRIRNQKKFSDVEGLALQLKKDAIACKKIFKLL